MHIIKTAFKKAWPNSLDNSILLGDWCKNQDSIKSNEIDKLKIIEYHFNDRKKFYDSRKEIDSIYDELLIILTSSLNKFFNKKNDRRYWEIIWGCWLHTFVLAFFDRNKSIESVLKKYPNSTTNILNPKSYIIATNTAEYLNNLQNDFYNFQIYSSIWHKCEGKIDSVITHSYSSKKKSNSVYQNFKFLALSCIRQFFKLFFSKSKIISFNSGFSRKTLVKIILKSKFNVIPFELFVFKNKIIPNHDIDLRNDLKNILVNYKKKKNNFLNFCLDQISDNAPIGLIEGYKNTLEINSKSIKNVKYLFSANGFINDNWNILCAENIKNGAKLINCQHGGGYGIQKFSGFEDYEIKIADKFITAGWKLKPNDKFITMPLPFINKNSRTLNNKNGQIFYIKNDYSLYLYRIFSHPVGRYADLYRKWSRRFLQNLDKNVLSNILVRPNYKFHSDFLDKKFHPKNHQLKYDNFSKSFDYQLKNCKIAISDTNQTTYLQSIALNIPTIVFWNPESSEIKKIARSFIDDLNRVGILHYSPESAAIFLNLNHKSINKWWFSDDVQEVRFKFINNYAKISDKWVNEWVNFFKSLDNIFNDTSSL